MKKILPFFVLLWLFSTASAENPDSVRLVKKAAKIHEKILTIDSHNDTPMRMSRGEFDWSVGHDVKKDHSRVDLVRMKEGGLDAAFFAVFVSQGKRTPDGYEKARDQALEIFDSLNAAIARHPDLVGLALTPSDARRLERQGKRIAFIGMENGYPVGKDLSLVQTYYDKGARYITLVHTKNNDICDSSTDTLETGGLSKFGEEVVREMNRLGMMIDVSHASDFSFYDILEVTKAPVIASHSCARALCDNPRNLDDEMLFALAENGGVIQMCILSDYVKTPDPRELATVSDVVDHIDHIVQVAGIDHVGIGTDFDGGGGVTGCYDVSEMGNITLELVRRGYSEEDIRKIWGGNLMRVLDENIRIKHHFP
ncbi:MAG: dipeptidase [bacterium]